MSSLDVICQGQLKKEGGKGHNYKNTKSRFFVLKDLFLFYFTEKPDETKPINSLKGILFVPNCKVKDNPAQANAAKKTSFILASKDKEYVISVPDPNAADAENYLLSWRNSLEYVIERTANWKEGDDVASFLQKRGGKGHGYKNWKKRWCKIRGNLLMYYDAPIKREDDISGLKGFIELSQIMELDSESDQNLGNDFKHNFRIVLASGKEFIFAAKDDADKNLWAKNLKKRIKKISKLSHPVNLDYKETPVKLGKLTRIVRGKPPVTNYFVLSNLNLRFYRGEVDSEAIQRDWTLGLLGTVPLVGAAIFSEQDGGVQMSIIDVTGNRYTFAAGSPVKEIIRRGDTIRLNCLARSEAQNNGYTALNLDKQNLQLNFFMLKRKVEIPFKNLKRVYMTDEEIFCLRYETQQEIRVLNIICANAKGVHDAINAAFQEIKVETRRESKANDKKKSSASLTDDAANNRKGSKKGLDEPSKSPRSSKSKEKQPAPDPSSEDESESPRISTKKPTKKSSDEKPPKKSSSKQLPRASAAADDKPPRTKSKTNNRSSQEESDEKPPKNDESSPAPKKKKSSKSVKEKQSDDDE